MADKLRFEDPWIEGRYPPRYALEHGDEPATFFEPAPPVDPTPDQLDRCVTDVAFHLEFHARRALAEAPFTAGRPGDGFVVLEAGPARVLPRVLGEGEPSPEVRTRLDGALALLGRMLEMFEVVGPSGEDLTAEYTALLDLARDLAEPAGVPDVVVRRLAVQTMEDGPPRRGWHPAWAAVILAGGALAMFVVLPRTLTAIENDHVDALDWIEPRDCDAGRKRLLRTLENYGRGNGTFALRARVTAPYVKKGDYPTAVRKWQIGAKQQVSKRYDEGGLLGAATSEEAIDVFIASDLRFMLVCPAPAAP